MIADNAKQILVQLGVDLGQFAGSDISARSPVDGGLIATLKADTDRKSVV